MPRFLEIQSKGNSDVLFPDNINHGGWTFALILHAKTAVICHLSSFPEISTLWLLIPWSMMKWTCTELPFDPS